jgi:hypothetical protein
VQQDQDLKSLDELIAELGGSKSGGASDLLFEHLRAARRNLLGSMPGEYGLSLKQAIESTACFPDKTFRNGIRNRLRSLMDPKVPKQFASAP